jgi:hypothetical protein
MSEVDDDDGERKRREEAWIKDRTHAQRLLGPLGHTVVGCLPLALLYMLRRSSSAAQESVACGLARFLNDEVGGKVDPVTSKEVRLFPLGRDVQFTAWAYEALTHADVVREPELCRRVDLVRKLVNRKLREYVAPSDDMEDAVGGGCSDDVSPGDTGLTQVVIPVVFGGALPLSEAGAREMTRFVRANDETTCLKMLDMLPTFRAGVRFDDSPSLSLVAFGARLERLAQVAPCLLYQALCEAGVMGPKFYEHAAQRVASYPFGKTCLPLAYARHLDRIYE